MRTNKLLLFLFLNQNICCRYSKEPSLWSGSFEHPKHMWKLMGKKLFTIYTQKNFVYRNLWMTLLYCYLLLCHNSDRNSRTRDFLYICCPQHNCHIIEVWAIGDLGKNIKEGVKHLKPWQKTENNKIRLHKNMITQHSWPTVNVVKFQTLFLFLFLSKLLVIRAEINKMLARIANREDHNQTASSESVWSGSALFVRFYF